MAQSSEAWREALAFLGGTDLGNFRDTGLRAMLHTPFSTGPGQPITVGTKRKATTGTGTNSVVQKLAGFGNIQAQRGLPL
jgi:hypothetical protein